MTERPAVSLEQRIALREDEAAELLGLSERELRSLRLGPLVRQRRLRPGACPLRHPRGGPDALQIVIGG